MSLEKQLLTIVFSLIFGFFFYLILYLSRKILFQKNLIKRIVSNILFIIDMVLLYFLIIKYINNGTLTYYSYIFMFIGIVLQKMIIDKLKTYKK